jgi:site-specific recombinase XerD
MNDPINSMKTEMMRRRFSIRTIETYCYHVGKFLLWYKGDLKKLSKKDINEFMNLIMDKHYAGNTINLYWNSLKYFIEEILHKRWLFKIRYAKKPKSLPFYLTKEEVAKLIDAIKNQKHKLMISLMYSAGLRVSELVGLRAVDIDIQQGNGWVRKGKGNKDRIFIIAEKLKDELKRFIEESGLKEEDWLFKGNNLNHLSTRTVQEIIKKARKTAKLEKKAHPHTLRHSFATHLVQNGTDIISVQSLLGHTRIETTMQYVHMASPRFTNVKSPFDSIM